MSQILQHETRVETCLFCRGNGRCAKCDGEGFHLVRKGRRARVFVCNACEESGECRLCRPLHRKAV